MTFAEIPLISKKLKNSSHSSINFIHPPICIIFRFRQQNDEKVEDKVEKDDEKVEEKSVGKDPVIIEKSRDTPALDQTEKEINILKQQLIRLKELRYQNGYAQVSLQDISKLEAEINKKEVRKRRLIRDANDQRNKRKKTKENIKEICENDENAAKILKSVNRKVTGRPRSLLKHGFMNTKCFLNFFLEATNFWVDY